MNLEEICDRLTEHGFGRRIALKREGDGIAYFRSDSVRIGQTTDGFILFAVSDDAPTRNILMDKLKEIFANISNIEIRQSGKIYAA